MVNGHVFYFYKNMPYEIAINKKFEQAQINKKAITYMTSYK